MIRWKVVHPFLTVMWMFPSRHFRDILLFSSSSHYLSVQEEPFLATIVVASFPHCMIWCLEAGLWECMLTAVLSLYMRQSATQEELVWISMRHSWGSSIQQKNIKCKFGSPMAFRVIAYLFWGAENHFSGISRTEWSLWCRFGYMSNTKIKFVLVTTAQDFRDADVRNVRLKQHFNILDLSFGPVSWIVENFTNLLDPLWLGLTLWSSGLTYCRWLSSFSGAYMQHM